MATAHTPEEEREQLPTLPQGRSRYFRVSPSAPPPCAVSPITSDGWYGSWANRAAGLAAMRPVPAPQSRLPRCRAMSKPRAEVGRLPKAFPCGTAFPLVLSPNFPLPPRAPIGALVAAAPGLASGLGGEGCGGRAAEAVRQSCGARC